MAENLDPALPTEIYQTLMAIIIFSPVAYKNIKQRIQHFADILSKKNKVLFIQPAAENKFKNGSLEIWFPENPTKAQGVDHKSLVYKLGNLLGLNYLYRLLKSKQYLETVKNKILSYQDKQNIALIQTPPSLISIQLLEFLKLHKFKVIYDLADRISAFKDIPRYLVGMEKILMKKADLIVATHQGLVSYARKYNKKVRLIENGADIEHFKTARNKAPRKYTIFYFGTIDHWFDFDLIEQITRKLPNVEITIIGPNKTNKKFNKKVKFLGQRSYRELPALIKDLQVGVIPFRKNRLTENVNPVKLYEYLAAGKPVVSIGINLTKNIPEYFQSETQEKFIANLTKALIEQTDLREIDKYLAEYTWVRKAEELLNSR